ncbi:hypothetical protein DVH24_010660 [Malus domestica]|uniref:Uncharacterized protein n=1 Tax=Malus domestica TaxID=3750 RepID=A0A498JSZ9_MALDO|nr:hypothetical protein DVH24_010660 [Malus domestica]
MTPIYIEFKLGNWRPQIPNMKYRRNQINSNIILQSKHCWKAGLFPISMLSALNEMFIEELRPKQISLKEL